MESMYWAKTYTQWANVFKTITAKAEETPTKKQAR